MKRRSFFGALAAMFGLPWLVKPAAEPTVTAFDSTQAVLVKHSSGADVLEPVLYLVLDGKLCCAMRRPDTNTYRIIAREC